MAENPDEVAFVCLGCDTPFTRRECPWPVVDGPFRFHSIECRERWFAEGQPGMS